MTIDIDHNGNGNGTFGRCNGNREDGKEETFVSTWEKEAIEDGEVEVGRIEHKFDAQQNGQRALAREEAIDASKQHNRRYD